MITRRRARIFPLAKSVRGKIKAAHRIFSQGADMWSLLLHSDVRWQIKKRKEEDENSSSFQWQAAGTKTTMQFMHDLHIKRVLILEQCSKSVSCLCLSPSWVCQAIRPPLSHRK